jgi:CBS domain containing-hemolysin-like protein
VALSAFPNHAVGLATGVMTFLIVVFGEVMPKSIATRNNVLIAGLAIYPIFWLSILFWPVIKFLEFIPRIAGKIKKTPAVTEQELLTFVEVVEEEGEIKEEERELIHNIFEFDDTNASEIMTPRSDMFVIEADEPINLEAILASGYSRIPVIENEIDNVIGILQVKDLFINYMKHGQEMSVRDFMHTPYFVPENKKLDKLLQQFKARKHHMAILIDEHGGVSGLITLEDALEELVGEIRDETDREEPLIVETSPGEWIVLGKTEIDEINEHLPMEIPDIKEYDTFSGYVLHQIGRIPKEKEDIRIDGFKVTVEQMDGNRIIKYILKKVT